MKIRVLALVMLLCICMMTGALADVGTITLNGDSAATDSTAVIIDGNTVLITVPGEYTLTGELEGQVVVSTAQEGKTKLILDNASIHCENSAAIYIKESQSRVTVSLKEDTVNKLSGGVSKKPAEDDETPTGVLYSTSNLTITGAGQLSVKSNFDGIVSKDDVRINDGIVTVSAGRHGIRGKDCVEISGGTITVECEKDGIRTTSTKDSDHGYISVTGGVLSINCGSDAFSYVTRLSVTEGIVVASHKE